MNVVHELDEERGGGRRARSRARRLDEIESAALALVREEGIEALTTHALAKRLDLAVGALYRYFPSKSALLAALERRALGALGERLRGALDASEGGLRGRGVGLARLVIAARAYARFARERPTESGLIGQLLADPRTLVPGVEREGLVATTTALLGVVAALFAEAAREGSLSRGEALERAVLYWSGLRGVLELSKLSGHAPGLDAAQLADAMTRVLLLGFGAEGAAVTRAFTAVHRYAEKQNDTEVFI